MYKVWNGDSSCRLSNIVICVAIQQKLPAISVSSLCVMVGIIWIVIFAFRLFVWNVSKGIINNVEATMTIRTGFLRFEEILQTVRKTKVWQITSVHNGSHLGTVGWYTAWRKYCAIFSSGVVFDEGCLQELSIFLHQVNAEHANAIREVRKISEGNGSKPSE